MADTPALNEGQINEALQSLPGWRSDDDTLTKTFDFDTYLAGVAFVSAVGTICEGMGHHPDMYVTYQKVNITFTTHDAGSKITQKDIDAASAVEALGYPS